MATPDRAGSAAADISYAGSARTRAARALIRGLENLTGRPRLIRMAEGYHIEVAGGRDFWEVMQDRYRLRLELAPGALELIPRAGPLVMVSNHPFGILDGLAMGRLLSATRGRFRIVANTVFRRARELDEVILPISFDDTMAARRLNLATRRRALQHLAEGGAVGVFPGGTVSTAARPFSRAMDPAWKTFTARLIARSGAAVAPVFFEGQNSRLFQLASRVSRTLRLALLIKEFGDRVGEPVRVTIGRPLDPAEIAARNLDPRALMEHLREATYRLSPRPIADLSCGRSFD